MQDIISLYRKYPKYDNLHDLELQHHIKPSIYLNQYKKHYLLYFLPEFLYD